MTIKFCKKCQVETERRENGGRCIPCAALYNSAYRSANPDKTRESIASWKVSNRERRRATSAAYHLTNRDKINARSAAWGKENPERVKDNNTAWYLANSDRAKANGAAYHAVNPESCRLKNHTRRARKIAAGGLLSKGLTVKLFKLQGGMCPCCKQSLGSDFHLDHKMPLALGGANEDWNMQLLRKTCNRQKGAQHPIKFMQSRGFLL